MIIDHETVGRAAFYLATALHRRFVNDECKYLFGVPRGGIPAAYAVGHHLCKLRGGDVVVVDRSDDANIVIDDLVDSGKTRDRYAFKPFGALFAKGDKFSCRPFWYGTQVPHGEWLTFPWEGTDETASADDIVTRFLTFIGEDPNRGGLKETPARVIKAWRDEWFSGYKKEPSEVLKAFEDGAEKYDEMIIVRDIPVYTHCEHHLAPFFGEAHVAYIPNGKIVGLSKFPRLVDIFARRLQVQERLTAQIADAVMEHAGARGVGVILKCRHLCMESRGIQRSGTSTITSVMRGALFDQPAARSELMALLG